MTKTYLTLNGQPLGILSPRDEEIFACGKVAALAELRVKVKALQSHYTPFASHDAFDDVIALIDEGAAP